LEERRYDAWRICSRSKETNMEICPHCQSKKLIKYGKTGWNNQRYQCKECDRVMNEPKHRGNPPSMKATAILLYSMFSASFRGIGRLLRVSDVTVYK
jgi:transposase-like protein